MLLHSPIRDVYLCIQGFDSRLACRICNNTVQSSIRADGPSVGEDRRRKRRKRERQREKESLTTREKQKEGQKRRTEKTEGKEKKRER